MFSLQVVDFISGRDFGIAGGFISYHIKIGQPGLADSKSLMCMGIDIGARHEGDVINFIS